MLTLRVRICNYFFNCRQLGGIREGVNQQFREKYKVAGRAGYQNQLIIEASSLNLQSVFQLD